MAEEYIRPDWDEYFLNIAQEVSKRSTCLRRRYGAIIVKDKIIVSTGYNGAPRGEINCIDAKVCERERLNIPKGERYELCIAGDSVIKLLDGTYRTIKQLAEDGKNFWTYAVDTKSGCIVPALAENPRKTGVRTDILKITFDNGKSVTCTEDHKFLLSNCKYKVAKDLKIQESIMPMYYNFATNDGYESVCNTISMRKGRVADGDKRNTFQIPTHHLVYEFFHGETNFENGKYLVHHKDENKINNTPENLEMITRSKHSSIHLTPERIEKFSQFNMKGVEVQRKMLLTNPEFLEFKSCIGSQNMSANWNNLEFRQNMHDIQIENGKNSVKILNSPEMRYRQYQGRIVKGLALLIGKMAEVNDTTEINFENYSALQKKYRPVGGGRGTMETIPLMKIILKWFDNDFDRALQEAKIFNHRVIKIEKISKPIEVYDVTVPKYHNFPIDLGDNSCVFVHNCVAVHAEQNAIINGDPLKMKGATIYIVGINSADGSYAAGEPCLLCRRMIKNAQIEKVVCRNKDGSISEIKV
ncbi:MAG: HNH endonuclease [Selenomonadaceae bacterium]|nr:HNH endonuclease [Selenomonadaceae bacterium]